MAYNIASLGYLMRLSRVTHEQCMTLPASMTSAGLTISRFASLITPTDRPISRSDFSVAGTDRQITRSSSSMARTERPIRRPACSVSGNDRPISRAASSVVSAGIPAPKPGRPGDTRRLWGWLNSVFNQYDLNRVEEVGANRACAEWLLRCGAAVRWSDRNTFLKDYNSLPVGGPRLAIAEVDATDSAIMNSGFEHFRGCKEIQRVVLHRASYIDDEALRQLQFLRRSLRQLQVSACGNVTSDGLKHLAKLSKLEYLLLYDFPAVRDKAVVVQHLEEHLPHCTVVFTYASDAEQRQLQQDRQRNDKKPEEE